MGLAHQASASVRFPAYGEFLGLHLPAWGLLVLSLVSMGAFLLLFYYVPGRLMGRRKRGPEFAGPALTGTARVQQMAPGVGSWSIPPVYWIGLRVEVPGREPYDASAKQQVPKEAYRALRRAGGTVAVQVDSTNPHYVWIDFTQPVLPAHADWPPPGQASGPYAGLSPGVRTYVTVLWWLVGIGSVSALAILVILIVVLRHG
ncbi:hypothetical protein [Mycobacterium sp. 1081908.1]|uniref:hypothetical protein n=1 Tax=Mycobacterium sp. 1081908.1 TaxID=1834066 RepID=UPI0007FFA140|nr:hypothetical protein [Mycobacterium sp. 1081908.1]OBK49101.1 hypothetical protein A5655_02865 [Mycobacterium sp. 1081908.1]